MHGHPLNPHFTGGLLYFPPILYIFDWVLYINTSKGTRRCSGRFGSLVPMRIQVEMGITLYCPTPPNFATSETRLTVHTCPALPCPSLLALSLPFPHLKGLFFFFLFYLYQVVSSLPAPEGTVFFFFFFFFS